MGSKLYTEKLFQRILSLTVKLQKLKTSARKLLKKTNNIFQIHGELGLHNVVYFQINYSFPDNCRLRLAAAGSCKKCDKIRLSSKEAATLLGVLKLAECQQTWSML